ncbi:DHH family phosphoesterase [Candidatus Pacearchaeota archaeon]|nr:hypothetical protein [uncultured archaeon]MBS3084407.1 DHH family phosphoesterase [Candidatus Pacearchaeota archaeon]
MLIKKEILELREHLEKSQNPLYYFDNDQDGLCSYLLLKRFYKKGNGIPVKTSPLGKEYFRRVEEFNPDYIFILDQPTVSKEFFDLIFEKNLPVVWIDHHETEKEKIPENIYYYNSFMGHSTPEPVTKICYEVTKRKEDIWLLVAGCLADRFFPEEYTEFSKDYPDLSIQSKDPFKIFYSSGIGEVSRMMGTGLKDRTGLVMKMIKFLLQAKTPYEVLEEKSENLSMHKRFGVVDLKLKGLIKNAKKENSKGNVLFFRYSGEISMSADIANRLSYDFPKKVIAVVYLKGSRVNISVRGKNAKKVVEEAVKGINLATFGGHNNALGVQMDESSLEEFEKNLISIVNKKD